MQPRIMRMVIVKGLEDYGLWCRKGVYHLISYNLTMLMVESKKIEIILELTKEDITKILFDYKKEGMPKEIVEYLKQRKNEIRKKDLPKNNALWVRRK